MNSKAVISAGVATNYVPAAKTIALYIKCVIFSFKYLIVFILF